jgi:hypothetical protein
MTATPWAVELRRMVHSVHMTKAAADATAAELRKSCQRDSDVQVRPRPPVAPGWRAPRHEEARP